MSGPDHSHYCESCREHWTCQRYYERECPYPDNQQCEECENSCQDIEDRAEMWGSIDV